VSILELRGLRAGFGANTVLHGVDLDVADGERAALLGLNGAGKSVTLKVAGGFVPAWGGQVLLSGRDVTSASPEARVAAGVGHVPQGRQLFPQLTIEENLRLGAYLLRRRTPAEYKPRLDAMFMRFPRLGERRAQLAGSLSGGEQAMLAVARALMSEPTLILVDEPSAGLAPMVAGEVIDLLHEVNDTGVAVLLVEQNVGLALKLAQRVHLMQQGRIVHTAAADALDHDTLAHYLGIGRLLMPPKPGRTRAAPKQKVPAKKLVAKKAAAKKATPRKKAAATRKRA
jgi:branched-chain amino acid transport system ATP-binding protein